MGSRRSGSSAQVAKGTRSKLIGQTAGRSNLPVEKHLPGDNLERYGQDLLEPGG